jgi:hypothetical protein
MRKLIYALAGLALAVGAAIAPAAGAAAGAPYSWCTSNPGGGQSFGGFVVYNGEWNSNLPQQICANSAADVRVHAHMTLTRRHATCPAVLTYPDVQYNTHLTVSKLTGLRSYYTESQPKYPAAIGEFASDDWAGPSGGNNQAYEVMVWQDNQGQGPPPGRPVTGIRLAGQSYRLYHAGGYFAFVRTANAAKGSIPHLAAFRYLIAHGYIAANTVISQTEIGWEICTDPSGGGTYTLTRNKLMVNGRQIRGS